MSCLPDPNTSEWVPLLTISSEDFKNASTPISSNVNDDDGRSTTPMTPTSSGAETSEGNGTVSDAATTTTIASPTHVTEDSEDDKNEPEWTTTIDEFSMGYDNETTTSSSADDGSSANTTTTVRPSFPSLEGVDYRMSEYQSSRLNNTKRKQ